MNFKKIHRSKKQIAGLLILCLSFLVSSYSSAQSWYEIEIIIFEHVESNDSSEQEIWPSDLNLDWPSPLLELKPNVTRGSSSVKPAFEEMHRDDRRLNNDAYAFRVKDPYRLLWHKSWRAPLLDEELAPWILVQADEQIGDHYRLEGGVRVHLSRYLHLSTDLWLTEIAQSFDSNTPISNNNSTNTTAFFDWSQLPKPALTRWNCNYFEEFWPDNQRFLPADYYQNPAPLEWYYPFGCETNQERSSQDFPLAVSINLSDQDSEEELRKNYPELFNQVNNLGINATPNSPINQRSPQFSYENGETAHSLNRENSGIQYPLSRIIHISDSRRMRSTEVHYIDHPKIGILATIYPVTKPSMPEQTPVTDDSANTGSP